MNVRAKFVVISKTPSNDLVCVCLAPVSVPKDGPGSEDALFGKWTPSGSINLGIANPAAAEALEVGKSYYVDFTPAG